MIEGASEVPGHADRGLGTTAQQLAQTWKAISGPRDVVEFYGHGRHARQFACFSNFYDQRDDPFWFSVSNQLDCKVELPEDRRRVSCAFSEKAIMLCKAAVMGDVQTYVEICEARRPHQAKTLGRRVQNFNGTLWDRVVCHVAFHVVYENRGTNISPVPRDAVRAAGHGRPPDRGGHHLATGIRSGASASTWATPERGTPPRGAYTRLGAHGRPPGPARGGRAGAGAGPREG
ncbi:unnamed protein product [Prorocentrum cordatum]|uniref:NADAR domain-containing protein n=1 Tax=Prorocentrum cordatum TaxID=2364126 RepID=A0ABN9SS19_9DINO|nr:unnamed protein product [Polarella glacialis]